MNTAPDSYGVVHHPNGEDRIDHLFRISLKALVLNNRGEVLLVKESGRHNWDIPGGGMEHGETIKKAIQRELAEEVNLTGDFAYQVIATESPTYIQTIKMWQLRIVFAVWPENDAFSPGDDGDEIYFASIEDLKKSERAHERIFAEHAIAANKLRTV